MTEELGHYQSRAVRALVLIHDQYMREFLQTWKEARAKGIRLPETDSEDYKSLDHLLRHVLRSSGIYISRMCGHLKLSAPDIPPVPEVKEIAAVADEYLEDLLAYWRLPLAGVMDADLEPEVYVPGMHYWVDAMLEHAAFHPIRHQFQLKELMRQQTN